MHVGIDARMADVVSNTGIGRYTSNLIKHLAEFDSGYQYTLYVKNAEAELAVNGLFNRQVVKAPVYSLKEQIQMPRLIKRWGVDIFHSPHYVLSLDCPCPAVITVHDIIHLLYPASKAANLYARVMLPLVTRKASRIIAVSHSTKNDLVRKVGVKEDKVAVIHNGIDERFQPVKDQRKIEELRRKYGLPEQFILYVGTTKPHKNLPALIKAFAYVLRHGDIPGCKLVVAAKKDSLQDLSIVPTITAHSLENEVIFIGQMPDEDMPLLYSAALLLAFPSLYEGFGLPPLEAMACGTPVVCSNTSSLPEVVGDAALLVNPRNIEQMGDAILQLILNQGLRQEMIQKGLERTKSFSWRETTNQTLELYRSSADQRSCVT